MTKFSLGELNAKYQRIKKSIAELEALRIEVAQAERKFKSSRGSYEVRSPDGRPSQYFYWDDVSSRRLRPEMLTGEQAEHDAKALG